MNSLWTRKIDPAFDTLIRVYRDFLTRSCLPRNTGYTCLTEESLKLAERKGYPTLSKQYDLPVKSANKSLDDLINLGVSPDFKLFTQVSDNNNLKNIAGMIDALPVESKAYYKTKLILLGDKEQLATIEKLTEAAKRKILVDLGSDIACLLIHTGLKGYFDEQADAPISKRVNKTRLTKMSLMMVYDTISQLTHKRPLTELVAEAKNGSDESLFKAIQIDKTLFDMDWVRKRIRKAQYEGDSKFFKALGEAISKAPLDHDVEYGELLLILTFFWDLGLNRLTNRELIQLLEAGGVRVQDDPETFRKFIERLKKEGIIGG